MTSTATDSARFETGYMDTAWADPSALIAEARDALRGVKYDTMVGTGMSGAIIVPVLARALRKKFLIVRKDEDLKSSHASRPWLGVLGRRWLFVDDFISLGGTFARVRDAVDAAVEHINQEQKRRRTNACSNEDCDYCKPVAPEGEPFTTTLVGSYMYERQGFKSWADES